MPFYRNSVVGGEPHCGGGSGGFLNPGCDPKVSTLGLYNSTQNSTFPQLCTPTHKKSQHRQLIHPVEPCFFMRATPTRSLFPVLLISARRPYLSFYHRPHPPPPAPGWRPLFKQVHASWPKLRKWLEAKTPQDGPGREVSTPPGNRGY